MQALLWLAIACGIAGAFSGNRTAWPLLASVGLCKVMERYEVPYDWRLWVSIDLAVIALIFALAWKRGLTRADWVVLALFAPAFVAYALPPDPRYFITMATVICQLMLTFPAANAWGRLKRIREHPDRWNEFDLRAAHACAGG